MELKELLDTLLSSGDKENEELAVTLLASQDVDPEVKKKLIDVFIKQYTTGTKNYLSEDNTYLFNKWVEIYKSTLNEEIKQRITKI